MSAQGKQPPRSPRRWWVWLVAPLGVIVAGAFLYGLFVGYKVALKPDDRALILTVDEVATALEDFKKVDTAETLERRLYTDGSKELSYEYEDIQGAHPIYVMSTMSAATSARDARAEYIGLVAGVRLGTTLLEDDMKEEPRDDLLKWGDESRSTILTMNGNRAGNYFVARKGDRIFSLMVSGVYYDDPAMFDALVRPHLERMTQQGL
jgi:hypothetical protein